MVFVAYSAGTLPRIGLLSESKPASRRGEASAQPVGLRKRYAFKVVAAVIAALTGVAVDAFGSHSLGPADYGQFYFLQQFFAQTFTLLSGSVSLAFVVRSSRRPRSHRFGFLYVGWLLLIPLLMESFVFVAGRLGWAGHLWPSSALMYVHLGAIASYLLFLGREGTAMGDAYGLTVQTEWARIGQRAFALALIAVLFVARWLNLSTLLVYTCVANGVLVATLIIILRRNGKLVLPRNPFRLAAVRAAGGYFYEYSSPLVIYLMFAIAAAMFDRWLLQIVAGNVDQGFFSLAYQISQVMLLFVTAFVPLLMREMSIAHSSENTERLRLLFKRSLDNLYFLTAFFACFTAAFCDRIAVLMGGDRFVLSAIPVALVVLSSVYRTYGQVTATLYYAAGKTALFRNVSIGMSVGSLVLTYVLVGPRSGFGWGMGATGLALKTFLYEMIATNVLAYFATRFLEMPYWRLLGRQLVVMVAFMCVAFLSREAVMFAPLWNGGTAWLVVGIGLAGVFYVVATAILLGIWPGLAGLQRHDLRQLVSRLSGGA